MGYLDKPAIWFMNFHSWDLCKVSKLVINISKRGIFWPPVGDSVIPGYGNPAASLTVKFYLTVVKEERLLARTVPIQVEPFLIQDLAATSSEILKRLSGRISSPTLSSAFCFCKRTGVFKDTLIWGNRVGDLGRVKTKQLLYFPQRKVSFSITS